MMTWSAWPNDQQAATQVPRNSGHPPQAREGRLSRACEQGDCRARSRHRRPRGRREPRFCRGQAVATHRRPAVASRGQLVTPSGDPRQRRTQRSRPAPRRAVPRSLGRTPAAHEPSRTAARRSVDMVPPGEPRQSRQHLDNRDKTCIADWKAGGMPPPFHAETQTVVCSEGGTGAPSEVVILGRSQLR